MSRTSAVSDSRTGSAICERCTLADRLPSRTRGLLGRRSLGAGEGLLLRPARAVHTHFMRFAIDVVFLDAGGRVVDVRSALPPWRMARARGARAVLELGAGEAGRRGVRIGDELRVADGPEPRDG